MKLHVRLLRACCCRCALSGCMIGPDYVRPAVDVPAAWRIEVSDARDLLGHRVVGAIPGSGPERSDRIGIGREQGRAHRRGADRGVSGQARGHAARNCFRRWAPTSTRRDSARRIKSSFITYPDRARDTRFNSYQAILSASWEIDLWGQLRRATEAARDDLLATTEAKRAVVLSLVASVASSYITLANLDRQLEISRLDGQVPRRLAASFRVALQGRRRLATGARAEPIALPGRVGVDSARRRADRPDREPAVGAART